MQSTKDALTRQHHFKGGFALLHLEKCQRRLRAKSKKARSAEKLIELCLVPEAGIEPARLAAGDFESPASTNFTTRAGMDLC